MFVVIILEENLWFLCGFGFNDFLELVYVLFQYLENFKTFFGFRKYYNDFNFDAMVKKLRFYSTLLRLVVITVTFV